MNTPSTHPAARTWDEARDIRFFTITAHLFTPQFCYGASTLLTTYDNENAAPDALMQEPRPDVLAMHPAHTTATGTR